VVSSNCCCVMVHFFGFLVFWTGIPLGHGSGQRGGIIGTEIELIFQKTNRTLMIRLDARESLKSNERSAGLRVV
jgi:hypothetical protein